MNSTTLYEKYDKKILKALLDNKLENFDSKDRKHIKKQLKALSTALDKNGFIKRTYAPTKCGIGRQYVQESKELNYQMMKKELRHTLAKEFYVDVDMENAHPVLLSYILKSHNISHPELDDYVMNRETKLKSIIEKCKCNRKVAKELLLVILYLGNIENYLVDNEITESPPKWVYDYDEEMKKNSDNLYKINNELTKKAGITKRDKNPKSSLLSIIIGVEENKVLMEAKTFLEMKGFTIDCLMFDGFFVRKPCNLSNQVLQELSDHILQTFQYNIIFTTKPMNDGIDLMIVDDYEDDWEVDETKLDFIDWEYVNDIEHEEYEEVTYNRRKKYLEHFICKIDTPTTCYAYNISKPQNDDEPDIYFKQKADMNTFLESVQSGFYNDKGKSIPFFDHWNKDPKQRRFHKFDFIPYGIDEDFNNENKNILNLFTGFKRYETPSTKKTRDEVLAPYFKLGTDVCGGDFEHFKFYLRVIANQLRNPKRLIPLAFIFKGRQGIGKNSIMYPLMKIIGEQYCIESADPDTFFGTHATGFCKKLLVFLNEAEGQKTFSFEGKIKSLITEPTIVVNPKFEHPQKIKIYSTITITTNRTEPVPIDVRTGDRRFVVYEGLGEIAKEREIYALKKYFEKPEFLTALTDYLMELDIDSLTINDRPITEAYMKMCESFIPTTCFFMEWFITQKRYLYCESGVCGIRDEEDEEDDKFNDTPFMDMPQYEQQIKIRLETLFREYEKFCKERKFKDTESIKTFKKKLLENGLPIEDYKSNGLATLKFKCDEVYYKMVENKFVTNPDIVIKKKDKIMNNEDGFLPDI